MRKNNKRGVAATSFAAFLAIMIAVVAQTGALFGGGGVGTVIGSSMFLTGATGAGLATNLPASVDPFREERAVEICEFNGGTDCAAEVSLMSKEEILEYIKDDTIFGTGFYHPENRKAANKKGGNLRQRILALQK